ncbi:MAG: DUF1641 domain-containing protein [Actinomycetota bacterium]|nr:DUF1641 domain-containing protein [Actinomycetota bacterium]
METATADRIVELERKLDTMSEQLALIAEELREQRLRRQQWDELRSDLSPIAAEAMALASNELEAMQDFVQPEDMLHLLRRILRNTKNIEDGMARYESLMDFLDDAGTLTNEAFIKVLTTLESFEQRGYFEFANAGLGVVDQVVTAYSKEDVEALGDNVVQMLDIVKNLTQPEMLAVATRMLDAVQRQQRAAELEPAEPPGLIALAGQMRDPEVRRGLARALNTFKVVSASETESAADTITAQARNQSPEGGA